MLMDNKKQALRRIVVGAVIGILAYLFLSWLTQPGSLFGGPMGFAFTFCFNSNVPEAVGAALGFLLWGAFGAEIALSTLPFAETGKTVIFRSLAHFCVMALTLWGWVWLNFPYEPLPSLIFTFLVPFTAVYALIWLIRWVKWYFELTAIRKKLGLGKKGDRP
ncbi:MAG: DUF3021 family protein [Oscillospiraceae bacterium]|nr:DUF3021 family protein [Oscillospiraceae bacterium]